MPQRDPAGAAHGSGDWSEMYGTFDRADAKHQAGRCLDCGNPYCAGSARCTTTSRTGCELVAGRPHPRSRRARATRPTRCRRCAAASARRIACAKAAARSTTASARSPSARSRSTSSIRALAQGWRPDLSQVVATGKRVAVIGAGPAGLACADRLVRNGIEAMVFDRYEQIGGLLQFGIPSFKLEKSVIATPSRRARRHGRASSASASRSAATSALDDVAARLRCGVPRPRRLPLHRRRPARARTCAACCRRCRSWCRTAASCIGDDDPHGRPIAGWEDQVALPDLHGKRVVVLGGGDTGMDCVRTAVRLGAAQRDLRLSPRRGQHARLGARGRQCARGRRAVPVQPPAAGDRSATTTAHVAGVRVVETQLGRTRCARTPRRRARSMAASRTIAADVVIIAFGFSPEPPAWLRAHGVEVEGNGRMRVGTAAGERRAAVPDHASEAVRRRRHGARRRSRRHRGARGPRRRDQHCAHARRTRRDLGTRRCLETHACL